DAVLDEVRDLGVEDLPPEGDHRLWLARRDCDVAETALARDETLAANFGWTRGELRLDEEFERLLLRADETPEPLDAAKRRLFAADLLDRDLAGGEPGENRVERERVVDLPAERKIFEGALAHDQAPGVRVSAEGEVRRALLGERHADPVAGEALPFGEAGRFDQHVSEPDSAVDGRRRPVQIDCVHDGSLWGSRGRGSGTSRRRLREMGNG